jgi:hypothetical protein
VLDPHRNDNAQRIELGIQKDKIEEKHTGRR